MKFSINRSVFIQNLTDVQRAISSRTTIPVLTGVKISVKEEYCLTISFLRRNSEEITIRYDEFRGC